MTLRGAHENVLQKLPSPLRSYAESNGRMPYAVKTVTLNNLYWTMKKMQLFINTGGHWPIPGEKGITSI